MLKPPKKFIKSNKWIPLLFLVLLNIIFRIPITPHETGSDSYFVHILANSIIQFGHAKWIIHPLSAVGLHPYSYQSGVPLLLSEFSIVSGISIELSIILLSICFGVLAVFTSYIMAGEIKNELNFKLTVAFVFSLSPLLLKYSIWTIPARGPFLVLLPLFIWSLLRYHRSHDWKWIFLIVTLFVLLATMHKLFYFTFLIMIAYFFAIIAVRYKKYITSPYLLITLCLLFFLLHPVFSTGLSRQFWVLNAPYALKSGEWYSTYWNLGIELGARLGFLLIFAFIGLISLIWKRNKEFGDLFLFFTILLFLPILFWGAGYPYQSTLPFLSLLAGIGIVRIGDSVRIKKSSFLIIVSILLLLLTFSIFTVNYRFTAHPCSANYLDESEFAIGVYVSNNIQNPEISFDGMSNREFGVASHSSSFGIGRLNLLINDYINPDEIKTEITPFPTKIASIPGFVRQPVRLSEALSLKSGSKSMNSKYKMLITSDEELNLLGNRFYDSRRYKIYEIY
jgi:hypothetical protein